MKEEIREALLDLIGYKHDATGVPTQVYGHGADTNAAGVFTYPGVDPQVFSTIMGNVPGVLGILPKFASLYSHPFFLCITGVTTDIGSEPTEVCGPVPTAGYTKTCKLTATFGRYRRQTREVYIDRLGVRINPSDPDYLRLVNSPNLPNSLRQPAMVPQMGAIVNNEIAKILFEFGTSVNALLSRQVFVGNPANNNGEAYKEFPGLDILIGTGKVDAETNTACPSLDSDIKNYNYGLVHAVGATIIDYCTAMARYLKHNAVGMGLMPARWVLAMRNDLFYELTAEWPCRYYTHRCQSYAVTAGQDPQGSFNTVEAIRLRDEMRRGKYLLIDGEQWPVVIDDGIPEENCNDTGSLECGQFASDIYFVPLTVLGAVPVTYVEFFDHNNPDIATALGEGKLAGQVWTTNNGAWIWTAERTRLCAFWEGKVEPRIILRTPQLAGRIQNVAYAPLQHVREPFPTDGYFVDGGIYTRATPSPYSEW